MRTARAAIVALAAAALVSGCVRQPGTFEWGAYDETLLEYYKDSAKADTLVTELERLSIAYETEAIPELGELLSRAASPDPQTRRLAVKQADAAFQPLDSGPLARLAPGLVAELGYLYLAAGNPEKAVTLFEKEKRRWPESAYFMDVMIRVAKGPEKDTTADAAAIEDEAARLRKAEASRSAKGGK